MRAIRCAWLCLGLIGCADGRGVIFVTVDSAKPVASVDSLRVSVTNAGQMAMPVKLPLMGSPTIPPKQTLGLRVGADRRGMATLVVDALDVKGEVLSTGTAMVELKPSETVNANVTLSDVTLPKWRKQVSETTQYLYGVWGTGPNNVYAVGAHGTILKSTNGGASWMQLPSPLNVDYWRVWGLAANDVWIVGSTGALLHSTNGGGAWVEVPTGAPSTTFYGFWASSANDLYVVGEAATILHSTDGGKVWVQEATAIKAVLYGVWGSGPDDVYLVGENGTLGRRVPEMGADGGVGDGGGAGATWVKIDSGVLGHLNQMWGTGADNLYIAGENGVILHSTDGGKTWPMETTNLMSSLLSPFGTGPDDVYVVGYEGSVLHRTSGPNWVLEVTATNEALYGVWAADASSVFAVGGTGSVLKRK